KLTGDIEGQQAESMTSLDQAPENITGDTATIGEGERLIQLKKKDQKWILPVSTLLPDITADNVDQRIGLVQQQVKPFTEVSDEMAAGKYKSVDEAGKALQTKMLQQAMGHAPATQPGPATAPSGM